MAQKGRSKGAEGNSARYKAEKRQESNRKRKLEAQLKLQPNNEQVARALKDIRYRRKTPTTPFWSSSMIATAKLFKLFSGRADRAIFSANDKIRGPALMQKGKYSEGKLVATGSMFALGTRSYSKVQEAVWK